MKNMPIHDKVSRIVKQIPPSGIRRFFDIASQNSSVISLGVGEPDFSTPPSINKAGIEALEQGMTHYTSNRGLPELIAEIASYLSKRFALDYRHDEILVTNGSSEGIDLALRMLINPGDEVLVVEPSYVPYGPIVRLCGGVPVQVPTSLEHEFKLTVEDLERVITPQTKALIFCYPNNPTGAIMDREDWEPIARFIEERDLIVISDEIYAELTYEKEHVSIASFACVKDRVILVSGLSKAFAMTGWRVGYVAASEPLLSEMLKIHQYTALCAPTISQIAAVEALQNGGGPCQAMVRQYDERRRLAVSAFAEMGLPCNVPAGAFYVFPRVTDLGMDGQAFAEALLTEEEVAVVPGCAFGETGKGHIRCSYATSIEELREAFRRMARFVERKKQALQPMR
ncbi:aminotransferase [Laceyella sediminis]|uniref:Aminotransferase n=3 Tax=Thermoactinomycetaceae TaxID=186824 RepID=A0AA45WN69_9BACL|nr:aminotransferase [Laceyella sediminis]SMP17200.1 aminotransferase [Laceyella tengchongensis]